MKKIIALVFFCLLSLSCTKELLLNTTEVTMFSLDKHIITSDGTNVSFSSQNPFVASVNETSGQVTAMHIGETYIDVVADQGTSRVKVNVLAKYNIITDPILDWNATKEEIKVKINYPIAGENSSALSYVYGDANNGDAHIGTVYSFGADKMLESVIVVYNPNHFFSVIKHLTERFQYYMGYDDQYMFGNALDAAEADTHILTTEISNMTSIFYYNPNK